MTKSSVSSVHLLVEDVPVELEDVEEAVVVDGVARTKYTTVKHDKGCDDDEVPSWV